MSLHTTTQNRSLANLEWSNDAVNILVEPISLIERGRRPLFGERGVGDSRGCE